MGNKLEKVFGMLVGTAEISETLEDEIYNFLESTDMVKCNDLNRLADFDKFPVHNLSTELQTLIKEQWLDMEADNL